MELGHKICPKKTKRRKNMDKKLTADRVFKVFQDCLFKDGEDFTNHVKAEGITFNVGFHPERLWNNMIEISEMLDEIHQDFHSEGQSFLNFCMHKDGGIWTGLQTTMQELLLLGIGIGRIEYTFPRRSWVMLPGIMPYLTIKP